MKMTRDDALTVLKEYGEDASFDYNDEAHGWFGWTIENETTLTITYQDRDLPNRDENKQVWRYQLILVQ